MNELERTARQIAAEIERRTGRKVKSVEVTVTRTSQVTRRRNVTRNASQ